MKKQLILILTVLFLNNTRPSNNGLLDVGINELNQSLKKMKENLENYISRREQIKGNNNAKVVLDKEMFNFTRNINLIKFDLGRIKRLREKEIANTFDLAEAFNLTDKFNIIRLIEDISKDKFYFDTKNDDFKKKTKSLINQLDSTVLKKLKFLNLIFKGDESPSGNLNEDLKQSVCKNSKNEDILSIFLVILKCVINILDYQINLETLFFPSKDHWFNVQLSKLEIKTLKVPSVDKRFGNFRPSKVVFEKKVIDEMNASEHKIMNEIATLEQKAIDDMERDFNNNLKIIEGLFESNDKVIDIYYDLNLVNKLNYIRNLKFCENIEYKIDEISLNLKQKNQNFKDYLIKNSEYQNLISALRALDEMIFCGMQKEDVGNKIIAITDKLFDLHTNFKKEISDRFYDENLATKLNHILDLMKDLKSCSGNTGLIIDEIALNLKQKNQYFKDYLIKNSEYENIRNALRKIDEMKDGAQPKDGIDAKIRTIKNKLLKIYEKFKEEFSARYSADGYQIYQQIDAKNKEINKINMLPNLDDSDKTRLNELTKEIELLSPSLAMCVLYLPNSNIDSRLLIINSLKILEKDIFQNAKNNKIFSYENVRDIDSEVNRRMLNSKFIDQVVKEFERNNALLSVLYAMIRSYIWRNYYHKDCLQLVLGYKWEILVALWLNSILDNDQKANLKLGCKLTDTKTQKSREFDIVLEDPKYTFECKDLYWKSYLDEEKIKRMQKQFKDEASISSSLGYIHIVISRKRLVTKERLMWERFFSSNKILFFENPKKIGSLTPRNVGLTEITDGQINLANSIDLNISELYKPSN